MSPAQVIEGLEIDGISSQDVVVVGAGPAGLMLAANLVRFGINTTILDDRADKTSTGRADGLQPKSIETLKQMRLADPLLQRGVRIHDICFWSSEKDTPLKRTERAEHFPPIVDLLDPYILLVHQGMVEDIFLQDLQTRGVDVTRSSPFIKYRNHGSGKALDVFSRSATTGEERLWQSKYLVGCDGAHSQVRKAIPDIKAEGSSSEAIWGVLDGVIETDFPDLWSKVVIYSEEAGNVLCIPRERNLTRLYIELRPESDAPIDKGKATQEFVMDRARQILAPYSLSWESVEWFGIYQIGQRVANKFTDDARRVFIAGDASHTHSPKAAQGMNTSMHDSLNLAWKLNLAVRGLAKPSLLETYEHERRKIAQDLINFDYEHANAFHDGDAKALARNFSTNIRFISGVGVEYDANALTRVTDISGGAKPGSLLPPARLTRYIDANPVDAQLDIPMLGQFRTYFVCKGVHQFKGFMKVVCAHISSSDSVLRRASEALEASYQDQSPASTESDSYIQPQRYVASSRLSTFCLITTTPKSEFEIADLPPVLRASKWTVYLDNVPHQDTRGQHCIDKWTGALEDGQIALLVVRPDGYVGAIKSWPCSAGSGAEASTWLDDYYGGFLAC
ncbi:FAD binding domain protein [Aureobasidium subglaciale]|nr:FAD binding domain protein [Aureobasidium subglaciale]